VANTNRTEVSAEQSDSSPSIWVTLPHGSWSVAGQFEFCDEGLVLCELRIFPEHDYLNTALLSVDRSTFRFDDDGRPVLPGRGHLDEAKSALPPVPRGGITARLCREIHFNALSTQARQDGKWMMEFLEAFSRGRPRRLRQWERDRERYRAAQRSGRSGRSDDYYLDWAVRYIDRINRGSRSPVADLATQYDMRPEQVRDILHQARSRDLLTKGTRGKAAGMLTDKGKDLFQRRQPAEKRIVSSRLKPAR
jgi:hypothetical protein